jgi:integrase
MEDMARSHNTGSIYRRKRDGLLVVAVSWPDGSRRRKYVPKSFALLKGKAELWEANRLLSVLLAERDAGTDRPSRLTLAAWLHLWTAELAASDRVRASTLDAYSRVVKLHIIPALGAWPLADLSVAAVQGWVDGMRDRSAAHRLGILHGALDVAEGRGMVRRNVARWVKVADRPDFRATPLTAEQAGTLIRETRADWYGPLWALLLGTGVRLNEALGLGWDDFDGSSIAVRTQLARREVRVSLPFPHPSGGSKSAVGLTVDEDFRGHFTDASRSHRVGTQRIAPGSPEDSLRPRRKMAWVRVPWVKADRELERIALPPFASAALDTQRVRLATARRPTWGYHGHVFLSRRGLPPHRGPVELALSAACTRLGLPAVRVHDLRGTSLTILREQGVDEQTRMARAGHHTVAVARHYAQTVTAEDLAAAAALQEAIGG